MPPDDMTNANLPNPLTALLEARPWITVMGVVTGLVGLVGGLFGLVSFTGAMLVLLFESGDFAPVSFTFLCATSMFLVIGGFFATFSGLLLRLSSSIARFGVAPDRSGLEEVLRRQRDFWRAFGALWLVWWITGLLMCGFGGVLAMLDV